MILYHFTSRCHVPRIINAGGLYKGDVMAGKDGSGSVRATWLSTSPLKERQGMNDHSPIELPILWQGQCVPVQVACVDKLEVRIKTKIPTTDRSLCHWWSWAQGRLDAKIIDLEVELAGSQTIAKEWYFYRRLIPLDTLLIELRRDDGDFTPATTDELSRIEPPKSE